MLWFYLSLSTAFISTFIDLWTKRISRDLSPLKIAQGKVFLSFFLFFIYFLLNKAIPLDKRNFPLILLIIPLEVLALFLYIKAISFWPLSHTIPLLSLTPLPLFLTSKIFLKENLNFYGIIGVIFIVFGSYILNISQFHEGFLAPFKALFKEEGSFMMLIVALIYSLTSAIGKKAIEVSSINSFTFNYFLLMSFAFLILGIYKRENLSFKETLKVFPLGFLTFLLGLFQFTSYALAPVVYVISLKRLSIFFTVISGKLFFKEKKIWEKVLGSFFMVLGSTILGLFS